MEVSSTAPKTPFLSLRHIEKIYPNGEKAVHDFNLEVDKKDFIVIVGPSGCGKSTTLRMIAGLEDITSGDIFLEGELLNYKPSKDRKMAIVFQSYALYPQMNVFDNIAFPLTINKYPQPVVDEALSALLEVRRFLAGTDPAALCAAIADPGRERLFSRTKKEEKLAFACGITPAAAQILCGFLKDAGETAPDAATLAGWAEETDRRITEERARLAAEGKAVGEAGELLDGEGNVLTENRALTPYEIRTKVYDTARVLDLVPYLDKLPKELSGGQMQRVALGRAIIKNVPVFMMDEPLSNLDAKLRHTMRSEIVKLHNRINATTIYVTHDQTEAMTMATRIVVMSRGFVQQIGAPKEIYGKPHNIFVAKFIGSPSMNIFTAEYDRDTGALSLGGVAVAPGKEFAQRHDAFYAAKEQELASMYENFDTAAREKILRLLSATGESRETGHGTAKKKGLIAALREKFAEKSKADEPAAEREICKEKLELVRRYMSGRHPLTVGIRPERIVAGKGAVPENLLFTARPTVCELLGGEYHIHFDFCGKDLVARADAKEAITTEDELTVGFSSADAYFFDPITGETLS